jgi:hypothetical protein
VRRAASQRRCLSPQREAFAQPRRVLDKTRKTRQWEPTDASSGNNIGCRNNLLDLQPVLILFEDIPDIYSKVWQLKTRPKEAPALLCPCPARCIARRGNPRGTPYPAGPNRVYPENVLETHNSLLSIIFLQRDCGGAQGQEPARKSVRCSRRWQLR